VLLSSGKTASYRCWYASLWIIKGPSISKHLCKTTHCITGFTKKQCKTSIKEHAYD